MKIIIYKLCFMLVLGLHSLLIAQTPQVLINSGEQWKYWANTAAPSSNNWKGGGTFDDSGWPSGASPLGYSRNSVDGPTTIVPTGCEPTVYNCTNKYPTIYFRKTFTITNINDYQKFIIYYQRDPGIALYVNGAEVKREFMPNGILTHTTSALTGLADKSNWKTISTDVSTDNVRPRIFLRTGLNVITAEVHQTNVDMPLTNSSDLRFNLRLEGIPVTAAPQVKIVRGPYLQMGTTSSMILRWSTQALTRGQVRYDTVATNLTVGNAQVVSETALSSDHQIKLTNLLPNRKYYYIIEAAGSPVVQLEGLATAASTHYFYTAPLPGTARKTRIWALGDFGTDESRQDSVIAKFKAFKQQNQINYVDMWLWMGDNAYDWGLDEDYSKNVFDKGKARYDWLFRQTPFYAAPGNHDYQSSYLAGGLRYAPHPIHYYDVVNNFTEAANGGGGVPSHQEEYYSFNYNNIHVVSLDSYGFETGQGTAIFNPTGPQVSWLKQDLAAAQLNPAIHWTILYWHHPPYTQGTYNSDTEPELVNVRKNLVPILENYKVDIVMSGHSHVYERSRLMKGLYPTSTSGTDSFSMNVNNPFLAGNAQSSGRLDGSSNSCFYFKNTTSATNEGVVYVVNGAGGRSGGTQGIGKWPHPAMQSSINEGGSLYLEIEGKRLDAKFISASGTVKDQFTIIKDNDGFPVPPTDGTTRTATCQCTDTNGFTHYTDSLANLLLSIKKNNYNIGTVGVPPFDLKLRGNAGVKYIDAYSPANYVKLGSYGYRNIVAPWIAFNRYWTLTPGTELSGNNQVIIRQYYKDADMTALNAPYTDDPMGHGNLK
ncbi:MAG: metallophosphoesterase family protein, partial [Spirosoma sp.]|nr:metallophosphoesterase family protein [Spirosoma sp.]